MTTLSAPFRLGRCAFAFFILIGIVPWGASPQGQYHILAKGETLYSVARLYGIKPDALAKANSIEDPSRLKAGTKLIIPGSGLGDKVGNAPSQGQQGQSSGEGAKTAQGQSPAVQSTSIHKVVKGDTLFSIARTYGVELADLRAANNLGSSSRIKPGDALKIPASASIPPVSNGNGETPPIGQGQQSVSSKDAPPSNNGSNGRAKSGDNASKSGISRDDPIVPDPVRTSVKSIRKDLSWPCPGEVLYLEGKAYGVIIKAKLGETERAVAAGTVSSAGPYRGYGNVVFILSRTGHIYVYGGNDKLSVRAGDKIVAGQELGKVGMDAKQGAPTAYFLVFKNGEAVDPALAPRD